MDIHIDAPWPACDLSNFAPHAFVFEGVPCASMEGLLQSFKFPDIDMQHKLCSMEGIIAKKRGRERTLAWQSDQMLHWAGDSFPRQSTPYAILQVTAFQALFDQSETFRKALAATGYAPLTHRVGVNDPTKTVLTEREFCQRLNYMRGKQKRGQKTA